MKEERSDSPHIEAAYLRYYFRNELMHAGRARIRVGHNFSARFRFEAALGDFEFFFRLRQAIARL